MDKSEKIRPITKKREVFEFLTLWFNNRMPSIFNKFPFMIWLYHKNQVLKSKMHNIFIFADKKVGILRRLFRIYIKILNNRYNLKEKQAK